MKKQRPIWTKFITDADIEGGYYWDESIQDYRVKVFTKCPIGLYYSAVNNVGLFFDAKILPTLKLSTSKT